MKLLGILNSVRAMAQKKKKNLPRMSAILSAATAAVSPIAKVGTKIKIAPTFPAIQS